MIFVKLKVIVKRFQQSKWFPIQVHDKRMMSASKNIDLSEWTADFIPNPRPSTEECTESAMRILTNKDPQMILEFVKIHGLLILFGLNKHFPHFIRDDVFSEAIFATYMAGMRLKKISGYRTYVLAYIFGYVLRYLRFINTQLSPYKARVKDAIVTEIPIFGEHQKNHYYNYHFDCLTEQIEECNRTPFEKASDKDFSEYFKEQLANITSDSQENRAIFNWVMDGKQISNFDQFPNGDKKYYRLVCKFRKYIKSHPEIAEILHERLA